MSFFAGFPDQTDQPAEPEPPVEPQPWEGPPEGEIPAVLPVAALLTANEHAAMVLAGVRVHSSGVELQVEARLRRGALSDDDWEDLLDRVRGFGHRLRRRGGRREPRIGVALSDGAKVLVDQPAPDDEVAAPRPRLVRLGGSGSGSDRSWVSSWTFWLWPLPPDGDLTVVAAWPQAGLEESSTVIDGAGLAAIAERARPVWVDAAPLHQGPRPSWSITMPD